MNNDIFDNKVLCKTCNKEMKRFDVRKNGFVFRTLQCPKCLNKVIHPGDKQEYQHYLHIKNKRFDVKLRMVGNSYTVSIPREIVNFINEQNKLMDDMVHLSMERMGKLSLVFKGLNKEWEENGR